MIVTGLTMMCQKVMMTMYTKLVVQGEQVKRVWR